MFSFELGNLKRKDFKTERAYLKKVYKLNQSKIIRVLGHGSTFDRFCNLVQARKKITDKNVRGALKSLANSTAFTPEGERFKDNVYSAVKSFGALKDFQSMTRDKLGHFTAYDRSKLTYDKNTKVYTYGGVLQISFGNSPQGITLVNLVTGEEFNYTNYE